MDAGDGARVGEPVWGLGGRKGWQGSAGWRRRRFQGRSRILGHGGAIGTCLAQDLKVLGCLVVLLVELGSIWEEEVEGETVFLVEIQKAKPRRCKRTGVEVCQMDMFAVDIPLNAYTLECKREAAAAFQRHKCLQKPVCGLLSPPLSLNHTLLRFLRNQTESWAKDPVTIKRVNDDSERLNQMLTAQTCVCHLGQFLKKIVEEV